MYYLTVSRDQEDIVRRETFEDYGEALSELAARAAGGLPDLSTIQGRR